MEIMTRAIDEIESLLGHSPHPAIVALPLGAFGVSSVSDVLGLVTGDERFDQAAEVSMAVGLIGAAGAAVTGLRDYSFIPRDRQPNHDIATTHALGNMAVGTLFATSYILRRTGRARGDSPSLLARGLAICGGALSVYTGWLGGKLVQELGEGVRPVMKRESGSGGKGGRLAVPAPGDYRAMGAAAWPNSPEAGG
jgi:uncharacterized membrane protein